MKKIIMTVVALVSMVYAVAQNNNKAIPIGIYVSEKATQLPDYAYSILTDKLRQIAVSNGMGADNHAPFFISCTVNLTKKDVIASAPVRYIQHADVSLYIADNQTERIYETYTISVKGVGDNEDRAFVNAFKNISPSHPAVKQFVVNGSKKIVEYYESQIDRFIAQAEGMAKMGEFESALYLLSTVPNVCDGYDKIADAAVRMYQTMIDYEGQKLLQKAKLVWATGHSYDAAIEAGEYLAEISPNANCYDKAEALATEIQKYVISERNYDKKQAENEVAWIRKMAENERKLTEKYLNAWRDVGVAYGQNQPDQVYHVWW